MTPSRRITLVVAAAVWVALSGAAWWYGIRRYLAYRESHDPYAPANLERALAEECDGSGEEPVPVVRALPDYPPAAERQGIQGWAIAEFRVLRDGTTTAVAILESDRPGVFDRVVVESVARWRYCPDPDLPAEGVEQKVRFPFMIRGQSEADDRQ